MSNMKSGVELSTNIKIILELIFEVQLRSSAASGVPRSMLTNLHWASEMDAHLMSSPASEALTSMLTKLKQVLESEEQLWNSTVIGTTTGTSTITYADEADSGLITCVAS